MATVPLPISIPSTLWFQIQNAQTIIVRSGKSIINSTLRKKELKLKKRRKKKEERSPMIVMNGEYQ